MKRTGLALALLFLAGGLADPVFCCTLPAEDDGARFAAAPMDCCSEEDTGVCAPKLERAANMPPGPLVSPTLVITANTVLSESLQLLSVGSTVTVERPPRLHLLHSQFRI
jgi:hypothetical protein